jgi:hypothetical protein
MANINTNIENSSIDDKSFALLRTNPKLTSNAKLLVNDNGDLFLSSFRANKELSKIEYQKYAVSSDGRYSDDIAKFYKGLPSTQKYQVLRSNSDTTVFSDYKFQYEDQYQYGAIHNITKLYDEQYKIFAPIWLDKKIPTNFVVYRIEDVDYSVTFDENVQGQNSRIKELLKNATIVKTFDLSKSSNIGKYLNNHINDKLFPESALTINFTEGSQSTFNGIDLNNGGFVSRAEQLDKYYTQIDYPEIFSNEIITQGFERNEIAIANIINLEFLFDDINADNYKIYRYFGLYTDSYEEGSFDSEGMSSSGVINVNSTSYSSVYDTDQYTTPLTMFPLSSEFDIPCIRWVKDKNGTFYNLKNAVNSPYYRLMISHNNVSADMFTGYAKNGKSIITSTNTPNHRGFIKFTVTAVPNQNDRLFICDKTELGISKYNLGDYIVIADPSILPGRANGNKFSNQGSLQQIAMAISAAIRNGEIVTYDVTVDGTSIIIEDYSAGNRRRQNAFGIYNLNFVNFITIDSGELNNVGLVDSIVPPSTNTVFSHWKIYTMIGGSDEGQAVLVDSKEIGNISVGEWVKQKDSNVFVQIIEIEQDPFDTNFYRVVLNIPVKVSNDNTFEIYEPYHVSHGVFAAYDFKDFDFDFYSTKNSKLGDLLYDDSIVSTSTYDGLNGVLGAETIYEDSVQQIIESEYDRLNENQLKETAILSRVVPTICKFELKDATNARNLPYVLNVNEAFGEDNLSPNIEIESGRKVEYMNMEHFHINKIPTRLYGNGQLDFNNYLNFNADAGLTLDRLKNTSFNYFDVHFNWNGYYDSVDNIWYDNTYKKLWSKFDIGNSERNSSAVFRGLRYSYLKRKENQKEVPTEFISDSNVNDYKFGVVFNYNSGSNIETNGVDFNVIKNDVFKFICVVVEVNMVENDVEYIDRYQMYSLTDIILNNQVLDTNIPFFIDFDGSNFSPSNPDQESILEASQFSILDGSAKFKKVITQNEFGEYSWIYFNTLGNIYAVKVVEVIDDSHVKVAGWPWKFDTISGETIVPSVRLNPSNFSLIAINGEFKYSKGGRNGFTNILNETNAYNFAKKFNQYGNINYATVNIDSSVTLNDFVLNIESGVDIIKPSLIRSETDPYRPKAYQLSAGEIGSIITDRTDGGYITLLRRMNGAYNPSFNNIITFSDRYTNHKIILNGNSVRTKLIYKKFNNISTVFDSHKGIDTNYGYINNYFFHKTNAEDSKNILKLSQTSDKLPLYPKIGEVAIDKKQINMFKSKYTLDYFTKSLSGGNSEFVNGTLSPVEKKTFLSSTIMKVKDTYDITKYTSTQEFSLDALDKVRLNLLNVSSIHWYEDDSEIIADIYLPDAILSELIEDGIATKFKNYVVPENSYGDKTTLDDDLKIYADYNISPRFIIDAITIYGIEGKDLKTEFYSTKYVSELTDDGFKPLTNYNIQSYQNDGLSFRLIYNKRSGYFYNFKIHVKIQA